MSRHVRVIVEGDAHDVSPGVMRLHYGANVSLMVDANMPAVTVEDLAPLRTWTPGDVVAGDTLVYRRGSARWVAWSDLGTPFCLDDTEMSAAVAGLHDESDRLTVLRYQAGDQ